MDYLVFEHLIVEGEVCCSMISPILLDEVIDIAMYHNCNVVIKSFHSWKMIRAVFHENNMVSSLGATMYVLKN